MTSTSVLAVSAVAVMCFVVGPIYVQGSTNCANLTINIDVTQNETQIVDQLEQLETAQLDQCPANTSYCGLEMYTLPDIGLLLNVECIDQKKYNENKAILGNDKCGFGTWKQWQDAINSATVSATTAAPTSGRLVTKLGHQPNTIIVPRKKRAITEEQTNQIRKIGEAIPNEFRILGCVCKGKNDYDKTMNAYKAATTPKQPDPTPDPTEPETTTKKNSADPVIGGVKAFLCAIAIWMMRT